MRDQMNNNTKLMLMVIVLSVLMLTACGKRTEDNAAGKISADWAFYFVVYNDAIYRVTDDRAVEHVRREIGEVEQYSDLETTAHQGVTFSNQFTVGSKLYEISEVPISEAIAIETGTDQFQKLVYEGQYSYHSLNQYSEPPNSIGVIEDKEITLVKGSYQWQNAIADAPSPDILEGQGSYAAAIEVVH